MCFPKIGVFPPKWMVKIMENPIKMDDLGGKSTIFGNTHIGSLRAWYHALFRVLDLPFESANLPLEFRQAKGCRSGG